MRKRAFAVAVVVVGAALLASCKRSGSVAVGVESGPIPGVDSAVFSPDGKSLAANFLWVVKVYDVASGAEKLKVTAPSGVRGLAWSPDGKFLAAACVDKTVEIWDAAGQPKHSMTGLKAPPNAIAWTSDGKLVLVAAGDVNPYGAERGHVRSEVRLFDPDSGKSVGTLDDPGDAVFSFAFAPDGASFVTGSYDGKFRVWDTATRKRKSGPHKHGLQGVMSLAFSPDGQTLATGSIDMTIALWDTATWNERARLDGHQDRVNGLAFVAGGRLLASASDDGSVRLWDPAARVAKGELLRGAGMVLTLAAQPHGPGLAAAGADGVVQVWDLSAGEAPAGQKPRLELR